MNGKIDVKKDVLKDENGNIKITSPNFGLTLSLIKAGSGTDEATGRKFSWGDSVKIIVGGDKLRSVKLTSMQTIFLRNALAIPEVVEELKARLAVEKAQLIAEAEGLN